MRGLVGPRGRKFHRAFLASGQDSETVRTALALDYALPSSSSGGGHPWVVACIYGLSAIAELVIEQSNGRIAMYDVLDAVRDDRSNAVILATVDRLARQTHQDYLENEFKKPEAERSPKAVEWEKLPEEDKVNNRDQIRHILWKINAQKIRIAPIINLNSWNNYVIKNEIIEKLAKMEHDRWVAFKISNGWSYSKTRDDINKLHNDITTWENLSEHSKEKDRNVVIGIQKLLAIIGLGLFEDDG